MKTISIFFFLLFFKCITGQTINWQENQLNGLNLPFYIGGFSMVSTEFADIDGDDDDDCFIGTSDGNIAFFENINNNASPVWKLITLHYLNLELAVIDRIKVELVDIDFDNDLDMFIGGSITEPLIYYKNIGNRLNPEWKQVTEFLNDLENGEIVKFCHPSFVDIDNDDDYDLIYGNYSGHDIFYENVGNKYTPNFVLSNSDFFGLSHFWNSHNIDFGDIDYDNDLDALIGTRYGLLLMKNIGTIDSAFWLEDTTNYLGINKYNSDVMFSPTFTDFDNNGILELYIGTEKGVVFNYDTIKSSWVNNSELYFDEGYHLNPEFADLNGDSKMEMIIPCYIAYNDSSFIKIYSNINTIESPVWKPDTTELIVNFPYSLNRVTFFDLDNDNDLDLIAGFKMNPNIILIENIGDINTMDFSSEYTVIAAFQEDQLINFYPLLVDYDNDLDMDLIVSAQGGTMNSFGYVDFFENTGSKNIPNWEYLSSRILGWGAIDCIDNDNDGDKDMLFGFMNSITVIYNKGNSTNPDFVPPHHQEIVDLNNSVSGLALTDINNDGKIDLIIGTENGGLLRFDNKGFIDNVSIIFENNIKVYPNPTRNFIKVFGLDLLSSNYELEIYDSSGKLVKKSNIDKTEISFSEFKSGIYYYNIIMDNENIKAGKIILIE